MATTSAKRVLAAAEAAMARKDSSHCMFAMAPERIKYLGECIDGLHPEDKEFPPDLIAEILQKLEDDLS